MHADERTTPNVNEPMLLSAPEVARLLGVSVRTLWRLLSAGKLPTPVRLGGSVRWRREEIGTWIEEGCPPTSNDARHRKVR